MPELGLHGRVCNVSLGGSSFGSTPLGGVGLAFCHCIRFLYVRVLVEGG